MKENIPPKKLAIFLYNRLFDPLIQSNFWLYVSDLLKSGEYTICLITYENPSIPTTQEQRILIKEWEKQGLVWKPLQWHAGQGLPAKFMDILQGFFAVLRFRLKGCRHFVSLASVAGTYLYLYFILLRFRFFLYQYEPHSEYAIDNQMWAKNSLQYKISHFLEKKAAFSAKVIASGTRFMQERLEKEWKVKAAFHKIPT